MEEIIEHPDGNITLEELQNDIDEWLKTHSPDELGFTAKTIQALINKISELSTTCDNLAYSI